MEYVEMYRLRLRPLAEKDIQGIIANNPIFNNRCRAPEIFIEIKSPEE